MKLSDFFSPGRFRRIFVLDTLSNIKVFILPMSAIFGLLFSLVIITNGEVDFVTNPFLFLGLTALIGIRLSSYAFSEIHHPTHSILFFMIPASIFEKFLSRLILTSVIFPISFFVLYYVFSLVCSISGQVFHHHIDPLIFDPNMALWQLYVIFIASQSIFLFGSTFFKSHPMSKTLIAIILFNFTLSIITGILVSVFHVDEFFAPFKSPWSEKALENLYQYLKIGGHLLFYGFIIPIFWTLTYFRLKFSEVK